MTFTEAIFVALCGIVGILLGTSAVQSVLP